MAAAVIDATFEGAAANSYNTVAEGIAYFEIRPGGDLWVDLDLEEQRATLLFALIMIERETFWGLQGTTTQALQFPRTGMVVIPTEVKHAQLEQALHLADGGFLKQQQFIESQSQGVREIAAGDTRVRMIPTHPDGFASYQLAPQTRQLLSGYIEVGVRMGRA